MVLRYFSLGYIVLRILLYILFIINFVLCYKLRPIVYLQLLSNITTYFRTISHKLMNLDISFTVQIMPIKNTQGVPPTPVPETNGFISKISVSCLFFHNCITTFAFITHNSSSFIYKFLIKIEFVPVTLKRNFQHHSDYIHLHYYLIILY